VLLTHLSQKASCASRHPFKSASNYRNNRSALNMSQNQTGLPFCDHKVSGKRSVLGSHLLPAPKTQNPISLFEK